MKNWQNQTPDFQKMSDLAPSGIFWVEKSKLVLVKSQVVKFSPCKESLEIYMFSPSSL